MRELERPPFGIGAFAEPTSPCDSPTSPCDTTRAGGAHAWDNQGVQFFVDIAKASSVIAADEDKENSRVASLWDDKAQKTGAVAGVFLAAGFGYLKPDAIALLLSTTPRYMGLLFLPADCLRRDDRAAGPHG